jgi:transposase
LTAGLDLGDKYSYLYLLDNDSGELVEEGRLRTIPDDLRRRFGSAEQMLIAIEVGTHSNWVSRLLQECGHEVLIANPRKTRLIYGDKQKTDKLDAQKLARLARADPELLYPIEHRGEDSQTHLALIHSRDALIRSRTLLINHVRGTVKSVGARLPKCSAQSFHKKVADQLPDELAEALEDVVATIGSLTERIRDYEQAHRPSLQGDLPAGDRASAAGSWSWGAYVANLCVDLGRSRTLRGKPQCGSVSGSDARQGSVWRERSR